MALIRPLLFSLLVLLMPATAAGQEPGTENQGEALRLFLDCSGFYCDSDYYRTEIAFVNHVRNREDADVHLLITPQQTGGGGTRYTLLFLGQRRFAAMSDTLDYTAAQTATEEERRSGLARTVKLGLARYAARTSVAERIDLAFRAATAATPPTAAPADPWNFWSFRASMNGFFQGESRLSSNSLSGSLSANRITDTWKIQFSANANERRNRFEVSDTMTIRSQQSSANISNRTARSLGPHWSAGMVTSASRSTFSNQDLHVRIAPGIEYSVYPYSEATRRQLTVMYTLGANYFDYDEITIFNKTQQTIGDHTLVASLDMKQPWGSMNLTANGSQFFHDLERYSAGLSGSMDLRLFKGLALRMGGSVSYVKDQIYLSAAGATPEEVLLRLQQLETNYRYFASVGLSYTFGSIFNNIVNPRFTGGGGGGTVFFF